MCLCACVRAFVRVRCFTETDQAAGDSGCMLFHCRWPLSQTGQKKSTVHCRWPLSQTGQKKSTVHCRWPLSQTGQKKSTVHCRWPLSQTGQKKSTVHCRWPLSQTGQKKSTVHCRWPLSQTGQKKSTVHCLGHHFEGRITSITIDFSRVCCNQSPKALTVSAERCVFSEAVWCQCSDGN